ncbi:interferon-induced protein with tetratricopeptide repeats 2-like isoform X2 [Genypterus blacodes]|uniref:interferon-induced protein with tetratricopeptide repeats 2-like isoform X2 n=1 Tax=Genypterus blacodes TaxID=154954 RepID=UPI003F75AA99
MSLKETLEALQCHFTWELESSRSKLLVLRDQLDDVGPQEGNCWLGHIFNLQGFVHFRLGSEKDARRCLGKAAEAFRQIRNTVSDEGPWLVVNYGNMAWLHFLLGDTRQSHAYVSQVEFLLREHPPPEELHAEVMAEKAWTLMNFGFKRKPLAVDYFQRAIRLQPDMVEWNTSRVLALDSTLQMADPGQEDDVTNQMRDALEKDPNNLYLAALYLHKRAKRGEQIMKEARNLARRVLQRCASSYSGIRPMLRLYREYLSTDEAIDLAKAALERNPDSRYLKSSAATCYKWKLFTEQDSRLRQSLIDRATSLLKEAIPLYSDSLAMEMDLASINAKSSHQQDRAEADRIYSKLLEADLDPRQVQRLYNGYAKYLHYYRQDSQQSIQYHMRAAGILEPSRHRRNSIAILERIVQQNRNHMCAELTAFLDQLEA